MCIRDRPYSTWTCGCGESNPMIRLSCHACDKKQKAQSTGMPKGFTCAACSKYSSPHNWSTITVTPEHGNATKLDVCSCADCGEYHPREVAVLNSAGLSCLLYTSDAADEEDSVDLGGRRIIKKKKSKKDVESEREAEE
eukprot:TRINITY_DN19522_c0_g1_i2.p1 TRINITY_DN19522_c0_g1~~TRINITY_DN19522_c0_g1_i2.p1  ORF type:complete len:139 (+),score=28.63 TRINITY_DN19522_c0_g1_i2:113-529(+)